MDLNTLKKHVAETIFGPTPENCCVLCKKPYSNENTEGLAQWREVDRTLLCGKCQDSEMNKAAKSFINSDINPETKKKLKEIHKDILRRTAERIIQNGEVNMDDESEWGDGHD